MLASLVAISLGAILVNNFVFSQFLGICPFLGVSNKMSTATGMSVAVIFVMTLASAICWVINTYLLIPLHLQFMQTVAFILVIAVLVQFVEMFLKKSIPALYSAMGIFLPLITTNCAVLGIAQLNALNGYTFIESVVSGFSSAVGYTLALVLLAGIRSRIREEDRPAPLRGAPIVLIAAALMSIAFMGFSKLSF